MGQPESRTQTRKSRRDGWTPERQLKFLAALARTRNVTTAAAFAGMSRESAYRLRARGELFEALWDSALAPAAGNENHSPALTDGWLARLLGNQFRRGSNGFGTVGVLRRSQ